LKREPPHVNALLQLLNRHGVKYVVTGSGAALLHGVVLEPGDLDVTPALDRENLRRLAAALAEIDACHYPAAPFGKWEAIGEGEQRWVQYEPTPEEVEARATWKPDPEDPASFDHLLQSRLGSIDIVPLVSGTYEELSVGAVRIDVEDEEVWVESVADLLATLTVPRRERIAIGCGSFATFSGGREQGSNSA
jgi:hypothetical protein